MTQSEFIEATSKIEQYYGKEYTNEQRQIMFKELGDIGIDRFRQLISAIIRKSKFLPKIADFIEANIETPFISQKDDLQKIECKKCNSTGYLIYTKIIKDGDKELKNQYACVCTCGNARKYEGWKVSDKRYRSNFYTPLAQEIRMEG